MAERIGLVRENLQNGFAVVVTDRKGACSGCHSGDGCRSCLSTGSKMESRVANPINAGAGDIVKISLNSSDLYKSAALFYLVPVACLFAAALAGEGLAVWAGWQTTTGSVLGGLAGLVLGIGLAVLIGRSHYARQHLAPSITAVVTSPTEPAAMNQPPCCG
jgi:positive regulator of sigma E activity